MLLGHGIICIRNKDLRETSSMFENIGGKIKGLAQIFFFLEAVVAIILGFFVCSINEGLVFLGVVVMFVGPLVAWVSAWLLYGFGELIENTAEIAKNTRKCTEKKRYTEAFYQKDSVSYGVQDEVLFSRIDNANTVKNEAEIDKREEKKRAILEMCKFYRGKNAELKCYLKTLLEDGNISPSEYEGLWGEYSE